ncbi:hypothetical protein BG015_004008 [Linnemannia schmuckeri]|uniref:Uncharacterized protein n=1 Tax=Linnemannia schmuckeri TaxID=64567 RepID=A0A9P5V1Y7_9FUNG|nr:hypothetical protein BG015_004008 [Linnemannia schmuckeri]
MQSPASSIQSPRPQGWQAQQNQQPGAFEKELMASLHVLLNQLGEVERQGLVMFHKIEESFKHPYTQQEAIADTANLLIQLETLTTQSKTTGFGALTHLPTSQTVASTPTPSASAIPTTTTPGPSGAGGTPKPMFLSPRMQNHIHNNQQNNTSSVVNINNAGGGTAGTGADTQMMSPTPVSVVGTPSGTGAVANANATTGSPSPFPTSDILMSATTPIADPNHPPPPTSTAAGGTAAATPATPSAWSSNPSAALAQMLDARQKDVQALSTEKRKLKTNFKVAAQMIKI